MTNTCSVKSTIAAPRKRVAVNGVVIPHDVIAQETQNHPAARPVDAWTSAARALAIRALLLQEADRLGVIADPLCDDEGRRETDEEARIRGLIEREVATPQPDETACRRYYDNNRLRFSSATLYEVRHILFAATPSDAPAREQAREEAVAAIASLKDGQGSFDALARKHSACPSRETGGSLGQIGPGQTVTEFEAALARAPVGRVCDDVVETRYGMHVVEVARRIDGRCMPFETAQPLIADYLTDRVQAVAQRQYISILAGRAAIEGIAIESSPTMLVR